MLGFQGRKKGKACAAQGKKRAAEEERRKAEKKALLAASRRGSGGVPSQGGAGADATSSCASAVSSPARRGRPDRLSLDALPPTGGGTIDGAPATPAESVGSAGPPLSATDGLNRQQEWPADGFGRVRVEDAEAAAGAEGTPVSALRPAEYAAGGAARAPQLPGGCSPPGATPLAQDSPAAPAQLEGGDGLPALPDQHGASDVVVHVQLQQQALVQQKVAQPGGERQCHVATQGDAVPPTPVPLIDRLPTLPPQCATLDLTPAGSTGSCCEGGSEPHSPLRSGPSFALQHAGKDAAGGGNHISGPQETPSASQQHERAGTGHVTPGAAQPHAGNADGGDAQDQGSQCAEPLQHEGGISPFAAKSYGGSKRRVAGMEPESEVKNQLLREIRGLKHHDGSADDIDSSWLV